MYVLFKQRFERDGNSQYITLISLLLIYQYARRPLVHTTPDDGGVIGIHITIANDVAGERGQIMQTPSNQTDRYERRESQRIARFRIGLGLQKLKECHIAIERSWRELELATTVREE
jgi:hypothetical protein